MELVSRLDFSRGGCGGIVVQLVTNPTEFRNWDTFSAELIVLAMLTSFPARTDWINQASYGGRILPKRSSACRTACERSSWSFHLCAHLVACAWVLFQSSKSHPEKEISRRQLKIGGLWVNLYEGIVTQNWQLGYFFEWFPSQVTPLTTLLANTWFPVQSGNPSDWCVCLSFSLCSCLSNIKIYRNEGWHKICWCLTWLEIDAKIFLSIFDGPLSLFHVLAILRSHVECGNKDMTWKRRSLIRGAESNCFCPVASLFVMGRTEVYLANFVRKICTLG